MPPPGPHGDDARRVAAALGMGEGDVLDLATSLNPVAPDVRFVVAAGLDSIRLYPDATVATAALAEAVGMEPENVLLTNGGAEAIALLGTELATGSVEDPEFSLYRRHLVEVSPGAPRWRSNPHNPTGLLAPPSEHAAVWDEAFYPLATGEWTRGDARSGAVVIGSLTKVFACPGLRIGYVLSENADLVARLSDRQPRWSVGGPALAAIPRLLEMADLPDWAKRIAALRADLVGVLEDAGLLPEPSDANFVLVRGAAGLRDRLARSGIVVRDCASFGMPGVARIAVPSADGIERLRVALEVGSTRQLVVGPTRERVVGSTSQLQARRGSRRDRELPAAPDTGGGRLTGALLVCGTASDVGKSQIVTGLCRLLARRGVRVAPFKAQNMSLNSFATPSGHEIGRAQGIQAIAAGTVPEVVMNPILLKPTGERHSQVVVMGQPVAELDAASYQILKRDVLTPVVLDAYADLRRRFDVVICEGAGSPAEINLLSGDLTNLWLAVATGMKALLVGDIERGGVFAALYGTMTVLSHELTAPIGGFVINKFRGDASLLTPGLEELERRTGVPTLGVLPFLDGLSLDAEDSLGLGAVVLGARSRREDWEPDMREAASQTLDVAVIALPHISNFTDLDALSIEPCVTLRLVRSSVELGDPDLIVLPGSKTTVADLAWLRASGLAVALARLAADRAGPTILGVCAGYQMLGEEIVDGVESRLSRVEALGLLPVSTEFESGKLTRQRRGRALGEEITGYEIRQGRPRPLPGAEGFAELDDTFGAGAEGVVADKGRLVGTSLHGLFESDGFRQAFLAAVAGRRAKLWRPSRARFSRAREAQIDRLADLLEAHLDVDAVVKLIAAAKRYAPW
ncbi:MAG: cobyric acid synthase [Acidimicrobiales bacterium]